LVNTKKVRRKIIENKPGKYLRNFFFIHTYLGIIDNKNNGFLNKI